jgi:tellurite resistance protein
MEISPEKSEMMTFLWQDKTLNGSNPRLNQHSPTLISSGFSKDKGKFTLEQAMKAQRGSRGIALLFP